MAEKRVYSVSGLNLRDLADTIKTWFRAHDFDSQVLNAVEGGLIVQARQPETWRTLLGLSSALNVTLIPRGRDLVVEMDAAKWEEKLAVGAVGLIIHPLLITAAYGAWKQSRLPEEIFKLIDRHLSSRGELIRPPAQSTTVSDTASASASTSGTAAPSIPLSAPQYDETICPTCKRTSGPEAKFCESCGSPMQPKPRSVPVRIE